MITLIVFAGFSIFWLGEDLTWNHAIGSAITLTVYLKGADGLDIRKRRLAARNGPSAKDEVAPSAKGNLEERALPNADTISWREFCTYGGALAFINLIPGAIGLLMVCVAPFLWYFDPAPWWQLTNPPAANAVSATR
ncbi:hypothetical protein FHT82_004407 [Rhizobium sp. BK275]|nr:hypothetical protein [Rhizobium sp. BK275]